MKLLKLSAAVLLLSGATVVMAQKEEQTRTARPPSENTTKAPGEARDAAPSKEGVGSRPIGPPSSGSTTGSDKLTPDQQKMDEPGKAGKN